MIGQIFRLYLEGKADARAGRKRLRFARESEDNRTFYLLGLTDERERMAAEGRLAQGRLELFPDTSEPDA